MNDELSSGPDPLPSFRSDAAHRSVEASLEAFCHLHESPSQTLARHDPQWMEKLGELDDLVFEAIAGRAAAVDRLRVLWPEVLRLIGPDLVAESREAYLNHALAKWCECAEGDEVRNPRLAVTLMDVLAVLLKG